jgi:hypothetical protein
MVGIIKVPREAGEEVDKTAKTGQQLLVAEIKLKMGLGRNNCVIGGIAGSILFWD